MLVDPHIHQLLGSVSTMTLSTCGQGGPHAAPVYFAADDRLRLYFFSETGSLHSRHCAQNPQAAAAIYPPCEGWQDIRGLQLHGEVYRVQAQDEWDMAWELYRLKFPFVRALKAIVAKNQLYVFTPTWVRLVDNSQGFGYKQEWNPERT
ncbi:MAG: pyridoxamine 5'-phosphate oxidase family protein [Anaerolineales bacterium]|nr:pyridoxamine 5'-phosphate oxidase family protein [Anaerolineales bacterium]